MMRAVGSVVTGFACWVMMISIFDSPHDGEAAVALLLGSFFAGALIGERIGAALECIGALLAMAGLMATLWVIGKLGEMRSRLGLRSR